MVTKIASTRLLLMIRLDRLERLSRLARFQPVSGGRRNTSLLVIAATHIVARFSITGVQHDGPIPLQSRAHYTCSTLCDGIEKRIR